VPEGIEHILLREHAARERDLMADVVDAVGHAGVPDAEDDTGD
jgi:hypothetical protein